MAGFVLEVPNGEVSVGYGEKSETLGKIMEYSINSGCSTNPNNIIDYTPSLRKLIDRCIHSSELHKIFQNEMGNKVEFRNVRIYLYVKEDNHYVRHKTPIFLLLRCGELMKPIFSFLDVKHSMIAFKYQYKNATPLDRLDFDKCKSLHIEYLLYIGKKHLVHSKITYPYRLNANRFLYFSFQC